MKSSDIQKLGQLIDKGKITTNQAREVLGLSKIDGGDQYLMLKKSCSEVHAGQKVFS